MLKKKLCSVALLALILLSPLFINGCDHDWDWAPATYQVTGQVVNKAGEGAPNVSLYFTGDYEGSIKTEEDGSYRALLRGQVTITPSFEEFDFDPPHQEVSEETDGVDFILLDTRYSIKVNVIGQGQIDLSPKKESYEEKTLVTATAIPEEGWFFEEWFGDLEGEENPVTFEMTDDKELTALFVQERVARMKIHSLDLSSGSGSLLLEEYGPEDNAYALLYSLDDLGQSHVVERISAKQEGAIDEESEEAIQQSPKKSIGRLRDPLFIWEEDQERLRNHLWASQVSPLLEVEEDPDLYAEEEFKIYLEGDQQETITATLLYKGKKHLFWVEENQILSSDKIEEINHIYESTIQPLVTEHFGREPVKETFPILEESGEKAHILLAPMIDYGGYFYSVDLYSSEVYPESNERKIIYVAYDSSEDFDYDYMMGTLPHELQHMIFYNERVLAGRPYEIEDTWINEGFSLLSEDITGYGYEQGAITNHVYSYSLAPHETSLLSWENLWPNYGITYLFARYIFDRFGKDILPAIYSSPLDPRIAQEELTEMTFQEVFEDWALALLLHQIEGINPRYTFEGISLDLTTNDLSPGSFLADQTIKGWGAHYTAIGPGNGEDLLIEVEGAAKSGNFQLIIVEMRGE